MERLRMTVVLAAVMLVSAMGRDCVAETPPQPRTYEVEEFAGWTVYAFDNASGFAFCVASAAAQDGIELIFSVDGDDNWRLALRNDDWSLSEGDTYDLRYAIDDAAPVVATGDAPGASMMRLELGGSETVEPFKRGKQLSVIAAKRTFRFDLAGSTRALGAARDCMARHTKGDRKSASEDPFATETSSNRTKKIEQRMIGGWTFDAMENTDGSDALCSITRSSDEGVQLLVTAMRSTHIWAIALDGRSQRWGLHKNQSYSVSYAIDDGAPVPASALAIAASTLVIPLGKTFDATDPLRGGGKIAVRAAAGTFSFTLDDSAAALDALSDCANRYLGFADAKSSDPKPAATKPTDVAAVEQSDATPDPLEAAVDQLLAIAGQLRMTRVVFANDPSAEGELRERLLRALRPLSEDSRQDKARAEIQVFLYERVATAMKTAPSDVLAKMVRFDRDIVRQLASEPEHCATFFKASGQGDFSFLSTSQRTAQGEIYADIVEAAILRPTAAVVNEDQAGRWLVQAYADQGFPVEDMSKLAEVSTLTDGQVCSVANEYMAAVASLGEERIGLLYRFIARDGGF